VSVVKTEKETWLKFECGREDRWTREIGPFEFLQVTYDSLQDFEGKVIACYGDHDWWVQTPYAEAWGIEKGPWSDIIIWGEGK
jgi:hypothetical protein